MIDIGERFLAKPPAGYNIGNNMDNLWRGREYWQYNLILVSHGQKFYTNKFNITTEAQQIHPSSHNKWLPY